MFIKIIKSLIKFLFLGTIFLILLLSLSAGSISEKMESTNDLATLPIDNSSLFELKTSVRAPSLIVSQVYEINDDYTGDSNGDADNIVDAGETIELRLELENTGDQGVTDVYGNLTSTNPFVSISSSNQTYIGIAAGATGISTSYYIIEFDSKLNASDIISFNLNITANEGTWNDSFILTVVGVPEPIFYGHIVTNEANGDLDADDDEVIDPGEVISIQLYVENIGASHLFGAVGYLSSTDSYVTIHDGFGSFGTIDGNSSTDNTEYGYFGITVSGGCSLQYRIPFNLSLVDDFGHFWNSSIELVVSGHPEYDLLNITFEEHNGDEDSYMDAGETWYASMTIRNIGDAIGPNVVVSMTSDDSEIEFYYSNTDISFDDLYAGFSDTKIGSYDWQFTISDRATKDQQLDFDIVINDDSGGPTDVISTSVQVVGVADYELLEFAIVEYCYYDEECNGIIDAGDTFEANITIMNVGEATGNEIDIYLYTNDQYVDFYYGNGSFNTIGSIDEGESKYEYDVYDWEFTISEKARTGRVLNFTIVIIDASLREWHFPVSIVVEDGPNTFFYTTLGIVTLIAAPIGFIAFCVFPYVRKRVKANKAGTAVSLSDNFKDWREDKKKKRAKKRKQRNKERTQKRKEKEAIRQEQERKRIANINKNEKKLLKKFESILEMTESVDISHVAKSLAISESQLFEKLIQWQEVLPFKIDGEFIEVKDTADFTQSVKEKIAEMSKYYTCYQCGFPIESTSQICPDCKSDIIKCAVCKLPISFGDEIGSCVLCEAKGHLTHMQEWLKTQGKCPVCLQKLPVEGLMQKKTKSKKK